MKKNLMLFLILLLSYSALAQYITDFSYNKASKTLDLNNLNVSTIHDSIEVLKDVEIIKFTRCNNINYRKLYRSIQHFDNLRTILFDDCNLGKIPPLIIKLKNLRAVRISSDRIQSVPRNFYKSNIKELILDNDDIGTISQQKQEKMFERLFKNKNLTDLNLYNNKIDTLYPFFVDSKLSKLDLGGNNIDNSYSILTGLINKNISFDLCLAYPLDSIKFINFLKSIDRELIIQIYFNDENENMRESINIYRSINSKTLIGARYRN